MLRDIKSIDPEVKLFFAPWSQPAWMKENALDGRLHGGTIQPRYYETYAEYIVKAMKAIQKEGLRPYRLSLQKWVRLRRRRNFHRAKSICRAYDERLFASVVIQ